MKKSTLIFICVLFVALTTHAQIVSIPDANFKAALIASPNNVDINSDGEIQLSEAQAKTAVFVFSKAIADLTGIEAFTNLDTLQCYENQLTALNVSACTALTYLDCGYNQITSLDFSSNTALEGFNCYNNLITTLNISTCSAMTNLSCGGNLLTTLDVSNNTALGSIYCDNNQLTALDVSNDTDLVVLFCSGNLNLPVICLNDTQLGQTISAPYNWIKDASAEWSTTCATSIDESTSLYIAPKLIHVYNLLGQEITKEQAKEGVYIYQYSDGNVKKTANFNREK